MRILLVEDEPHAAQALAKGLREQAYAVDVAADGEAAIFQSGTTDYDGLILDVMLPVVDGLTVCLTIRESGFAFRWRAVRRRTDRLRSAGARGGSSPGAGPAARGSRTA